MMITRRHLLVQTEARQLWELSAPDPSLGVQIEAEAPDSDLLNSRCTR